MLFKTWGYDLDQQSKLKLLKIDFTDLEEKLDMCTISGHAVQALGVETLLLDEGDSLLQKNRNWIISWRSEIVQSGLHLGKIYFNVKPVSSDKSQIISLDRKYFGKGIKVENFKVIKCKWQMTKIVLSRPSCLTIVLT